MKRQVVFHAEELADGYGLRTLYDYLKSTKFEDRNDAELSFSRQSQGYFKNKLNESLKNYKFRFSAESLAHDVLFIHAYSDLFQCLKSKVTDLRIDLSILKNCALPMSAESKEKLRKQYQLETKLPVLVVSYANCNTDLISKIIKEVKKLSKICLIDYVGKQSGIVMTNERGVLKDYYAIADASVNANNLKVENDTMGEPKNKLLNFR